MRSMTRERLVSGVRTILGVLSVAIILSVALPKLRADDAGTDAPPPDVHAGAPMFELYASDPGAVEYVDLGDPVPLPPGAEAGPIDEATYAAATRETQASVDDTLEWADLHNGPAVHAAYSAYTALAVAEAELRRAEYEAGLAGSGELGVH